MQAMKFLTRTARQERLKMVEFILQRKFLIAVRRRKGFTLIELLLVIAIMGVLTTMALAVLRSANESAKVSATQARIMRIEAILKSEIERFEVRRLPLSRGALRQAVMDNASTMPGVPRPIPFIERLLSEAKFLQSLIAITNWSITA